MTNKNLTEVVLLLDASGSMLGNRSATIEALQSFVNEQANTLLPDQELVLHLYEFSSRSVDPVSRLPRDQRLRPILSNYDLRGQGVAGALQLINSYDPYGDTPLYDAFGDLIAQTGARLFQKREQDRPSRVLFVVMTDGQENASIHRDANQVRAMVEEQTKTYNWAFLFLGANMDAIASASQLGISPTNAVSWTSDQQGTKAVVRGLSHATSCYVNNGAAADSLGAAVSQSSNT